MAGLIRLLLLLYLLLFELFPHSRQLLTRLCPQVANQLLNFLVIGLLMELMSNSLKILELSLLLESKSQLIAKFIDACLHIIFDLTDTGLKSGHSLVIHLLCLI